MPIDLQAIISKFIDKHISIGNFKEATLLKWLSNAILSGSIDEDRALEFVLLVDAQGYDKPPAFTPQTVFNGGK